MMIPSLSGVRFVFHVGNLLHATWYIYQICMHYSCGFDEVGASVRISCAHATSKCIALSHDLLLSYAYMI